MSLITDARTYSVLRVYSLEVNTTFLLSHTSILSGPCLQHPIYPQKTLSKFTYAVTTLGLSYSDIGPSILRVHPQNVLDLWYSQCGHESAWLVNIWTCPRLTKTESIFNKILICFTCTLMFNKHFSRIFKNEYKWAPQIKNSQGQDFCQTLCKLGVCMCAWGIGWCSLLSLLPFPFLRGYLFIQMRKPGLYQVESVRGTKIDKWALRYN